MIALRILGIISVLIAVGLSLYHQLLEGVFNEQ
jgi:hypothetical protein